MESQSVIRVVLPPPAEPTLGAVRRTGSVAAAVRARRYRLRASFDLRAWLTRIPVSTDVHQTPVSTDVHRTNVATILLGLARALQHVHGCGIIHRDFHEGNVLLQGGLQSIGGPAGAGGSAPRHQEGGRAPEQTG